MCLLPEISIQTLRQTLALLKRLVWERRPGLSVEPQSTWPQRWSWTKAMTLEPTAGPWEFLYLNCSLAGKLEIHNSTKTTNFICKDQTDTQKVKNKQKPCLSYSPPFSGSDHIRIYTMILHGIEKIDFPRRISKRPDDLIRRLCRFFPVAQILNHCVVLRTRHRVFVFLPQV